MTVAPRNPSQVLVASADFNGHPSPLPPNNTEIIDHTKDNTSIVATTICDVEQEVDPAAIVR